MDLQKLRQETEADHLAVEDTVPLMHDGLTVTEYVTVLRKFYGVVAAWEEHAAEVAPEWLRATFTARQRKPLIERDLAFFNAPLPDNSRPALPPMDTLPSLLGTMYVMEGSTLGGQYIARHIEKELHLNEGIGDAYFRGHGTQTGPMWKEFCTMLKEKLSDADTPAVVQSAKAMFAVFGAWMQEKSAIDGS